ncbi:MAG TPA: DISARM system SNF2-like helicase DrmD [Phycisphaerae bacterium]|nr:DISARM system SNF2-like helicase DrmD [Phycisphaerae bacterium]
MTSLEAAGTPRVGMVATVRNRRGIIASVEPFDGDAGRLNLVRVEYNDDQLPTAEELLWELEPRTNLLEPSELPQVATSDPMPPDDFDALVRATRWSAMNPYLDPDGDGPLDRQPIASPFHGAVQVEDYQLVPLLKALQMPRVSLLIADDVGLGKTVEAGLILSELLLRRRIQRVLILTPASLRLQWRDEMWDKFSLQFNIVDRDETYKLRRQLGIDANPWRSFSRIIASYHYLRQEDVLEQFRAASEPAAGSPHLAWDLLILDECHNLMPAPFGDDSGLCKMLRLITPRFEHRLFLSATPHNGHTRSFTGLLELLDPVRFSQTDEIKPAERARVQQSVIRRLKREINARSNPPKFCTRLPPKALILDLAAEELELSTAFADFRSAVRSLIAKGTSQRRRAGSFAIEILGKRLLSCPVAFAESWHRCKEGFAEQEGVSESDVVAAERSVREEMSDDREAQSRESTASAVVGAWLKSLAKELEAEIGAIDQAVAALGLAPNDSVVEQDPKRDARFEMLRRLVDELIRTGKTWNDKERLVVFTEYKTTLDYVVRRLRAHYRDDDAILTLFGGMDDVLREQVKAEFNDPAAKVRILVATDAAAEGLNLQRTARYMLHYDCPWNPSRLEQRNGRLDRHGQARDVTIHHFASNDDADLKFLSHVINKVDQIREDLGATGELFDEATHRRLVAGEDAAVVQGDLDRQIKSAKDRAAFDADDRSTPEEGEDPTDAAHLKEFAAEIDLDAWSLRQTLEAAMALRVGRPQLECIEEKRTCRIVNPGLPAWADIIDETLRRRVGRGMLSGCATWSPPSLRSCSGFRSANCASG